MNEEGVFLIQCYHLSDHRLKVGLCLKRPNRRVNVFIAEQCSLGEVEGVKSWPSERGCDNH